MHFCPWAFLRRDIPRAILCNQSGWGIPPPLPCPRQNCYNSPLPILAPLHPSFFTGFRLIGSISSRQKPTDRKALSVATSTAAQHREMTVWDAGARPVMGGRSRRGIPRGCPEVGHTDREGRHEACPYEASSASTFVRRSGDSTNLKTICCSPYWRHRGGGWDFYSAAMF